MVLLSFKLNVVSTFAPSLINTSNLIAAVCVSFYIDDVELPCLLDYEFVALEGRCVFRNMLIACLTRNRRTALLSKMSKSKSNKAK